MDWLIPRFLSEVWRFLGLVWYLATLISHVTEYTAVLDILTKKVYDQKFLEWILEYQKAFEAIKQIKTSMNCLTFIGYNSGKNIYVTTNATYLVVRQFFLVLEVFKYIVISVDWEFYSKEMKMLFFQSQNDHEHFLLMYWVVVLYWNILWRVKGYRLGFFLRLSNTQDCSGFC